MRRTRVIHAALMASALVIAASGAPIAQPAQSSPPPGRSSLGKTLDRTHANVVGVTADLGGTRRSPASGTLIGPRLVVTAGHVSPRPAPGLPPWLVVFGASAFQPERTVRLDPSSQSEPHPAFLAFVDANGRNPNERTDFLDVGLLALPESVTGVTPAALPAAHVLDASNPRDEFIGVGYGYHEVVRESEAGNRSPGDGNRRQWRTGVRVLNAAWIRLEDDPAKGYGQICGGDSGAAIFLRRGAREILVGVVSHSDGLGCGPGIPTYAVRVDNPAVLDWISDVGTRLASAR